ncbi:MAG: helical bundle domain-containing protein, partial [Legionella longbeachae]|nr:helical bundle domain-containing protein [Legionella longbeachae]
NQFFNWMNEVDKKEVEVVFQKINAITKPRYLLEDYILYMVQVQNNQDPLFMTRLSLVKRFLSYLYEQTELTLEVSKEIATYVTAIREKSPDKREEEFLDNISPRSTLENTVRFVTGLGMGFFRIVLQKKSLSELISGVSAPKN